MSRTGDQRAAVRVTQVIGSKEVVVKSAGVHLSVVPGIFGATIMGDGRVVVILDLAPLVRHGVALRQAGIEDTIHPCRRGQRLLVRCPVVAAAQQITIRPHDQALLESADHMRGRLLARCGPIRRPGMRQRCRSIAEERQPAALCIVLHMAPGARKPRLHVVDRGRSAGPDPSGAEQAGARAVRSCHGRRGDARPRLSGH